ncbi:hypothetical protein BW10_07855 [Bifidobacterium sp. UTBIF-56]|nr:hypothetical protein BW10_07855 [Bifidobacterium sp. UTBIF-56]TPF93907.1 hypothetical protein BW14_03555 [Bifidobacterium sp. UTBIF-68]
MIENEHPDRYQSVYCRSFRDLPDKHISCRTPSTHTAQQSAIDKSGKDFLSLTFADFEKTRNIIRLRTSPLLNKCVDLTLLFVKVSGIAN